MNTSTIPTVKAQMVTRFATALAVPFTYSWPGPTTADRCGFLGPHPATADIRLDATQQIPTIKAGRKQRQEDYTVRVTVWSFRPDLNVEAAATCEADAFAIFDSIEDVLADDPRIGLAPTVVQYLAVESVASTLFPFNGGWACELAADVAVKARLQ